MSSSVNGCVNEDSSFSVLARVHVDGANVTQSDLSSISYTVFNAATNEVEQVAASLTVSSVVFDTLQTDDRWDTDNTGYNFRHDVAHTVCTDPDKQYRFEYKFTTSGGSEFFIDPVVMAVNSVLTS